MTGIIDIAVPDIGDFADVPVLEVPVSVGDTIEKDDTILVLESDKATLDVPSDVSGRVAEVLVSEGDRVSPGTLVLRIAPSGTAAAEKPPATPTPSPPPPPTPTPAVPAPEVARDIAVARPPDPKPHQRKASTGSHASPSVRKLARDLGVDVSCVSGTGRKGRITPDDLHGHVRTALSRQEQGSDKGALSGLPDWPKVDHAKYGEIERIELSRIARISGPALARNAMVIPHVTNFEVADVTDLDAFRASLNAEGAETKLSLLPFVVKAVAHTLGAHPRFNASVDGAHLVLKKYINIGVATDTTEGLVVPVVTAADTKSVGAIAREMAALAAEARAGKLRPEKMLGATFTISSLGGIGGTNFTPIINAPEVAILGMTRAAIQPVWDGQGFAPRLIQPLSLSWDHRAVDGVAAAKFLVHLKTLLSDFRRISL
ncbi:2-oxo acid dehydrogenase subunit E2 [Mesobacterium pallidum]|uniref:2-oxo acid dehydrogenase subunit E2 n=1 Tax=Mesobacterium pallidum TaxID=2872037 RepID=UPI001EE1CC06|nr:2-oxo acid dehydrogenase subunit E2 [Mesobacterium pallidum]